MSISAIYPIIVAPSHHSREEKTICDNCNHTKEQHHLTKKLKGGNFYNVYDFCLRAGCDCKKFV